MKEPIEIQIRVFKLRLTKKYLEIDENKLNKFLKEVRVIKQYTNLIEGKIDYWTMIIQFEEIKFEGIDLVVD